MNIHALSFPDIENISDFSLLKFFGIPKKKNHNGVNFYYIENEGQYPGRKKHLVSCSLTGLYSDHDSKYAALRELDNPLCNYGLKGEDE